MKKHLPFVGGILLMLVPTLLFAFVVLNYPVEFGAFATMVGICILCLVVGASVALDRNIKLDR